MLRPRQIPHDLAEIHTLLRAHFADAVQDAAAIRVEGPIHVRRYSRIYRAHVAGLSTPLVVKCLLDPATGGPDANSARVQFEGLHRIHRAMATSDRAYRVPVPYFLAERDGVVVAEWIDGQPMTDLFLTGKLTVKEGRELLRRAAHWARCFFALRPLSPAPLDVSSLIEEIDRMQRTQLSNYRSARIAFAALRDHAGAMSGINLERSWLHGDFKTDNLLVTGRSVVGIDVHAKYENAVLYDLVSFVNHLRLTLCDPRAWRWRPHREALVGEFLDAFDATYREDFRFPYAWIALFGMLGFWDEFLRRRQRGLRHLYLDACFRHTVRRMTRELGVAASGPVR